MAPSRRKGANRAAAAAAARRKWKVGDLVLAKVKGFPAWPATVSEPEKWGYPSDWKKVVVYFFGTEQIAFCNPADVEEFTEEKKVSLLGKRHGKGADFVRAVKEIIDCFEKLKEQDQVSRANGTEETNITNINNSEESLTKAVKDEAAVVTVKPLSMGTSNDLNSLTEVAVAAAAEDALHDEEIPLVEAPSNLGLTGSPECTTDLARIKTDVARSQKSGSKRKKPAQRSKSSSRRDASRPRGIVLPSINNTRSSRRSGPNALQDRSVRRRKRIMKSSDDSEEEDVDSHALESNDSIEESGPEIMAVDADRLGANDGTSNLASKQEPFTENDEEETELSHRLDFQTNTVILKKKRKCNRKRHHTDTVEAAELNVVTSDAEVLRTGCASPSFSEKSMQQYAKDDGDEHLPLVKRARVRMGRPSPTAEEEITFLHKEDIGSGVPESLTAQPSGPSSREVDAPADGKSSPIKEDQTHGCLSRVSPARKPHLWEARKIFVDGEAALPPSKRLHRALEAMSANVAEVCQRASSCSPAPNTQSNEYFPSSIPEGSELSVEKKAVIESGAGALGNMINGESLSSASEFCAMPNVETSENDAKTIKLVSDGGKADSFEHVQGVDTKCQKMSPLNEFPAEIEHHVKLDSLDVGERLAHLDSNALGLKMSPIDHCETEHSELNKNAKESDPDISQMDLDRIKQVAGGSPNINTGIRPDFAEGEGDGTQKMKNLLSAEDNQDGKRSESEEARPASLDSNNMLSVTPVKALNSFYHQSLFHSTSVSDDQMDDRAVSVTQSSSSLTDGPDSVARESPPGSSICNISASDNNHSLENSSACGPDVQFHLEKAKLVGKSSGKGDSLSSFEAVIGSLTRTKDSIGRATRIAIDCAKIGLATKVVEVLARNLESESSLHKKVDLFFLVDSITQCSRGMKGDAGVYPSAIQALLPRLLLAAAPPGSSSRENHRQCLKVLRVWQERKILPEPIIRHHIRELDALCGSYPTAGSRRPLRNERAFDDPIREMEGMLVDEYGSNSSIQLPGFCMPPMLRDDGGGSDSDGESFEAVTPEHNTEKLDGETTQIPAVGKRSHILEDVDGELEMEDVAPCCEVEITSTSNIGGAESTQISPPPPPPPLPPSFSCPAVLDSVTNGPNSKPYSNSQKFNSSLQDSTVNQSALSRVNPSTVDAGHLHVHDNKSFEAKLPRQMPEANSASSFSDHPTSFLSGRGSNSIQPTDTFSKGFHLRPPHPAPSNQFSYVQEQRIQSRRDIPPPSHLNRYRAHNAENGNFYRDRDRNKYGPRDNIGECWKPPFPSPGNYGFYCLYSSILGHFDEALNLYLAYLEPFLSSSYPGPCYSDGNRIAHAPMSYSGPPHEPALPNSRWNFPPRPMNHRHFDPYRPPSEGPIPVANRDNRARHCSSAHDMDDNVLIFGDQDDLSEELPQAGIMMLRGVMVYTTELDDFEF
ncbi:protein HUA2-LIKE 3 [Sesamum angolense]|uniref:Protein HUA2-LIKE 3 n=1 Tax=Sesamum angolense TaxID=2727404 RepID=A0AAE1X8D3_9LAMI|nr:protein HUA2-LIKE 3 [Sesamum angolense]